jgi:hypothetical protein
MAKGHPQRHDLLDYVDGSLGPADRAEVKQHLDTCATCTELVADATAGKRLLAASPPLELSPGRTDSIMAALDEPAPKRERSRPSWRLVAVVAAALALAIPLSYVALSGDGDADSSGVAAEADNQEDAGGADTGAAAPQEPELTILRGTKGKPEAIVAALEEAGYTAEVDGDSVIVTVEDAKLDDVVEVLDDIGPGETVVFARQPR